MINFEPVDDLLPEPTDEQLERWAARDKAVKDCPEHDWILSIEEGHVSMLRCNNCPGELDDIYPDGREFLYGEIPVSAFLDIQTFTNLEGTEYDITIQIGPKE